MRSIAIAADADDPEFVRRVESFMSRVALTLFVGQGDRVVAYSSIGSTEISGAGQLLVPVIIAALIVLNTMMGAVYERVREIGIYSVVGLAPSHIGLLFLAESTVFATFGAVVGYALGQIARDIELSCATDGPEPSYAIAMHTWLAPYDLGISQKVRLQAAPTGEHRIYKIETHIERLRGTWPRGSA